MGPLAAMVGGANRLAAGLSRLRLDALIVFRVEIFFCDFCIEKVGKNKKKFIAIAHLGS